MAACQSSWSKEWHLKTKYRFCYCTDLLQALAIWIPVYRMSSTGFRCKVTTTAVFHTDVDLLVALIQVIDLDYVRMVQHFQDMYFSFDYLYWVRIKLWPLILFWSSFLWLIFISLSQTWLFYDFERILFACSLTFDLENLSKASFAHQIWTVFLKFKIVCQICEGSGIRNKKIWGALRAAAK